MLWSIFVSISFIVFLLTILYIIFLYNRPQKKRKISLYNIFFIGVIFALFFLVLPLDFETEYLGVFGKFIFAVNRIILVVTGNMDVGFLQAEMNMHEFGYFYAAFLVVTAPLLTIGFVLQFFTGFFARVQCRIYRSRQCYLFSELNEKSLILAKSIRNEAPGKFFIVFTDFSGENTDEDFVNDAKAIGALLLKKDILRFDFEWRNASTEIILCKEKEIDNISDVVTLLDASFTNDHQLNYYVFASEDEYANIASSYVKQKIAEASNDENRKKTVSRVILIDSIHSEFYRLFSEHPLYLGSEQSESIHLMVIGSGLAAKEAVQIASWFGQMMSKKLSIIMVCDQAERICLEFKQSYPEITMNCPIIFEDAQHFDAVDYAAHGGKTVTYIIVAQDNDLTGLKTAIQLKTIYAGISLKNKSTEPEICVWNEEGKLHQQLKMLKNETNGDCHLYPFGGNESRYSYTNIFNRKIDARGLTIHTFYGGSQKDFYDSEYNRRSSCALALHIRYTIYELEQLYNNGRKLTVEDYDRIMAEHEIEILRAEHVRWCAFMRARGYSTLPIETFRTLLDQKLIANHVIDTAKLHACLVDWDDNIGNPLSEWQKTFDNVTADEIIALQKNTEELDDLDRVTLICWEYLKKDPNIFVNGGKKQKKNFKDLDRSVLEIIPIIIEEDAL